MILSAEKTLLEDIDFARKAGFSEDFYYSEGYLVGRNTKNKYDKSECALVEFCRHEGQSDPSDASILFLIECDDGIRGCLSSAYGHYADSEVIDFVLSLRRKTSSTEN